MSALSVQAGGHHHRVWHRNASSEGVPILALHGFTGTGRDFDLLCPELHHPLLAPDLMGHGETDAPTDVEPYRMMTVVDQLEDVVHALLPNQRFILLGYSMGGRSALHLAARLGQQLAGLVLIGAHPGLTETTDQQQRCAADNELADQIEAQGIDWFQASWSQRPIIASQQQIPQPHRRQMQLHRRSNRRHGLANSLRGMGLGVMPPAWQALPRITSPACYIAGQQDARYTRLGEQISGALPAGQLYIIEGAGHCAHLEQPGRTLAALRNFFAAVDRETMAGVE